MLVGTKVDKEVDKQNLDYVYKWIKQMQKKHLIPELPFFQTSALNDLGVMESARKLATMINLK